MRRWRRSGVAALLSAIALAMASPALAVLVAPPSTTGGFEIDGDLALNNGGTYDWANTGTLINDGRSDSTQFGSGSEATNPTTWTTGAGGGAGKADIVDAYSDTRIVAGQMWTYFAVRRDSTTGTTAFSFEFNQLANSPAGGPNPRRSPGDLLLTVQQSGNNSFTVAGMQIWTLQSQFGTGCTLIPGYTPAAGWCSATLPANAFFGTTGENGAFAEGALNLSAVFSATCVGDFATLNIRSRSSTSLNAALQDWVRPIAQSSPGTCGLLRVAKVNQFGEDVAGATFSISPDPRPGSNAASLSITEGGTGDTDGVANGVIVVDPVQPGTYTVTETGAPPGYLLPPPAQRSSTVVVAPSGQSLRTYTDTLPWKPLTATKTAIATYDAAYDWSLTKTASPARQFTPDGTAATFDYTVTVRAGAETRSGSEVHGVISVVNPNTHAMVATLSDTLANGTTCTVDATDADTAVAGLQVSFPAGTTDLNYTCATQGYAPGTNTATLTWSRANYPQTQADVNTPANAAGVTVTATKDYVYVPDQLTDEQITVTDSRQVFDPPWVVDWSAGLVQSRSYSLDLSGDPGVCVNRDNTATITGDTGVIDEASASVEVCSGLDLEITKNATLSYNRTYNWAIAKSGPGTIFVGADDFIGAADYRVTLTATDWTDTDQQLGGTITVHNPNAWAVPADITDTVTVDGVDYTCTVTNGQTAAIPANESLDFDYQCDGIPQGDYVGTNKATATWDAATAGTPHSTADVTVPVTVNEDTTPTNETVTLTDSMGRTFTSKTWAEVKAAGGQVFEYSEDLTGAAGRCVQVDNTVTIDQTGDSATATTDVCSPTISATSAASYGNDYLWNVDKSVDQSFVELAPDGTAEVSYTVKATPNGKNLIAWSWTGSITVSNPSTTEPLTVDVTDLSGVAEATCVIDGQSTVTVDAGASQQLTYTCTSSTKSVAGGTNTVTASFGDESVSAQIPVAFTETGSTNQTIQVQDSRVGLLGTAVWNAAGDSSTFVYNQTFPAGDPGTCTTYENTATIPNHSDQANVQVCTEAPLAVAKTVDAGLTRTYHWSLDKTVREDALTGKTGDFVYDVTVRAEPFTDSAWKLSGEISLTNPNQYAAGAITASLAELPAGLAPGDSCTIQAASPVEVPAGETVTVPYTCALSAAPSADASNSASATWDPAGPGAETTVTSEPVPVQPAPTTEIDKQVKLVDDMAVPGTSQDVAGPLDWAEGLEQTYTYTVRQSAKPGHCRNVTNTASLISLDEQAPGKQVAARAGVLATDSVDASLCAPKVKDIVSGGIHAQGGDTNLPNTGAPAGLMGFAWTGWLSLGLGLVLVAIGWRRRSRSS